MNVVLMGGGMDSYAVLLYLRSLNIENVVGLHVDYGQKASEAERIAVRSQCAFTNYRFEKVTEGNILKGLNPSNLLLGTGDDPVLFGRNLILLAIAAKYGKNIYLGLDKPYNGAIPWFDCTLEYFHQAVKLIGNPEITVAAPFIDIEKEYVYRTCLTADAHFFTRTMTCWTPVNSEVMIPSEECGECKHCKTKAELRYKIEGEVK